MAPPSSATAPLTRQLLKNGEFWFEWSSPDPGSPTKLAVSDGLVKARQPTDFINMAKMCRVDSEGNLVLVKEDGSLATFSLRKGLNPALTLPSTLYEVLSRHGFVQLPVEAFYGNSPAVAENREFLSSVFPNRKLEAFLSSCRDGISVHEIQNEGSRAHFLVACHGEVDAANPLRTQFCTDPFEPEKQRDCLGFTKNPLYTNFSILNQCRPRSSGDQVWRTIRTGKGADVTFVAESKPSLNNRHLYESFVVVLALDITGQGGVSLPLQREDETTEFEGSAVSWMTEVLSSPKFRGIVDQYRGALQGQPMDPSQKIAWWQDHVSSLLDPSLHPYFDVNRDYSSNPDDLRGHATLMALMYSAIAYEASGIPDVVQAPSQKAVWDQAYATRNPGSVNMDPAYREKVNGLPQVFAGLSQPLPVKIVIRTADGERVISREEIDRTLQSLFARIALSHYAGKPVSDQEEVSQAGLSPWTWAAIGTGAVAAAALAVVVFGGAEEPASVRNGSGPTPEPGPGPGPKPEPPATGTIGTLGRRGGRGN